LFNWLSLDFIYYPVSGIMWVWYKLFSFLLGLIPGVDGPTNFFAWGLSVTFLVFTLRAILYRPFVRQIETTRQMQELQPQIKALQKKYGPKGFTVIGFPCNQFGAQEPGSAEEIETFCSTTYGVTFPMFEKVVGISLLAPCNFRLASMTWTSGLCSLGSLRVTQPSNPLFLVIKPNRKPT